MSPYASTAVGLAFEDLALALQQDYGIELPAYHAVGDRWLDAEALVDLDGIGIATSDKFGRSMALGELVKLCPGALIELDREAHEPADILVNGKIVARGEIVTIDQNYGVRITRVEG